MTLEVGHSGSRSCVLDASALLALLNLEPGGSSIQDLVGSSIISSVNWAEVLQKSVQLGLNLDTVRGDLESLGIEVAHFDAEDALKASELWAAGRPVGLSLGDRACLTLAHRLELPAVTADHRWAGLDLQVEILLIG